MEEACAGAGPRAEEDGPHDAAEEDGGAKVEEEVEREAGGADGEEEHAEPEKAHVERGEEGGSQLPRPASPLGINRQLCAPPEGVHAAG